MEKVETEARSWSWICPNEECCEFENRTEESDIDWSNDPPFTSKCSECGEEYELELK